MNSTREATLQLIQREISEVVQREKELKEAYSQLHKNNLTTNGISKMRNITSSTNGIENSSNNSRLFTQNRATKGAMQRFIKSRGKVSNISPTYSHKTKSTTWTSQVDLEKPVIPVGVHPRNGFISVEERLRKEFREMEERETELTMHRTKSQPDLLVLLNSHSTESMPPLQSARSVSQLSDSTNDSSLYSASPSSLKPARSLADLCDIEDEEAPPPGSVNLIKRWEGIIQKNQYS